MKPTFALIPFIAILFGFNGGSWESNNPFDYYLISPQKVHINESKKGLRGIKGWKVDQTQRAHRTGSDLPMREHHNCHTIKDKAFVCDYRQ